MGQRFSNPPVQDDFKRRFEDALGTPDDYTPELLLPSEQEIMPVVQPGKIGRLFYPACIVQQSVTNNQGFNTWPVLYPGQSVNFPVSLISPEQDRFRFLTGESQEPYFALPYYSYIEVNAGASIDWTIKHRINRFSITSIELASQNVSNAQNFTRDISFQKEGNALLPMVPNDDVDVLINPSDGTVDYDFALWMFFAISDQPDDLTETRWTYPTS